MVNEKGKKKFNVFNLIINLIALFAVVTFLLLLYFSYTNFNEVKNGNKPTGYKEVKEYNEDGKEITVYNYTLYKIVIVKNGRTETYMLKPIFTEDN